MSTPILPLFPQFYSLKKVQMCVSMIDMSDIGTSIHPSNNATESRVV